MVCWMRPRAVDGFHSARKSPRSHQPAPGIPGDAQVFVSGFGARRRQLDIKIETRLRSRNSRSRRSALQSGERRQDRSQRNRIGRPPISTTTSETGACPAHTRHLALEINEPPAGGEPQIERRHSVGRLQQALRSRADRARAAVRPSGDRVRWKPRAPAIPEEETGGSSCAQAIAAGNQAGFSGRRAAAQTFRSTTRWTNNRPFRENSTTSPGKSRRSPARRIGNQIARKYGRHHARAKHAEANFAEGADNFLCQSARQLDRALRCGLASIFRCPLGCFRLNWQPP